MTPGIWMAPFSADKHSSIAKEHMDWVLLDDKHRKPANSGNCGKWFYGYDLSRPEVR